MLLALILASCSGNLVNGYKPIRVGFTSRDYKDKLTENKSMQESINI